MRAAPLHRPTDAPASRRQRRRRGQRGGPRPRRRQPRPPRELHADARTKPQVSALLQGAIHPEQGAGQAARGERQVEASGGHQEQPGDEKQDRRGGELSAQGGGARGCQGAHGTRNSQTVHCR